MWLSILDQSHLPKGRTAEEAIQNTIKLAQLADQLGYTRFWVSEHHNMTQVAGSTPEVLLGYLAAVTKRIRLGSGGVMLPHYSALKVAENFRLLEAMAPGRIDLGIGRAPGGDRLTASLLNPGNTFSEHDFVEQLSDLQHYLHDSHEAGTLQHKVTATPKVATIPELWVLSSSGQSGLFAAHFGMGFSFAHFINPVGGPKAVEQYRQRFRPSAELSEPKANMAIFMFCSEDPERIRQVQAVTEYRFIQMETRGRFDAVLFDDVKNYSFSPAEKERLPYIRQRFVIGTPGEVKARFEALAADYKIEEIIAVNIGIEFEDRLLSYSLLSKAFGLSQ
jgi:luciferase family oxidoreductase group 1